MKYDQPPSCKHWLKVILENEEVVKSLSGGACRFFSPCALQPRQKETFVVARAHCCGLCPVCARGISFNIILTRAAVLLLFRSPGAQFNSVSCRI